MCVDGVRPGSDPPDVMLVSNWLESLGLRRELGVMLRYFCRAFIRGGSQADAWMIQQAHLARLRVASGDADSRDEGGSAGRGCGAPPDLTLT